MNSIKLARISAVTGAPTFSCLSCNSNETSGSDEESDDDDGSNDKDSTGNEDSIRSKDSSGNEETALETKAAVMSTGTAKG